METLDPEIHVCSIKIDSTPWFFYAPLQGCSQRYLSLYAFDEILNENRIPFDFKRICGIFERFHGVLIQNLAGSRDMKHGLILTNLHFIDKELSSRESKISYQIANTNAIEGHVFSLQRARCL